MATAYQRNRKYVAKNVDKVKNWRRKSHLKKKYGLTVERYNEMVVEQTGQCAICQKHTEDLCVDHNHLTGQIRSLLCRTCNAGIGNFYEDKSLLSAASQYLERWP